MLKKLDSVEMEAVTGGYTLNNTATVDYDCGGKHYSETTSVSTEVDTGRRDRHDEYTNPVGCVAFVGGSTVTGAYTGFLAGFNTADKVVGGAPPNVSRPIEISAGVIGAVAGAVVGGVGAANSPVCHRNSDK